MSGAEIASGIGAKALRMLVAEEMVQDPQTVLNRNNLHRVI